MDDCIDTGLFGDISVQHVQSDNMYLCVQVANDADTGDNERHAIFLLTGLCSARLMMLLKSPAI